MKPFTDYTEAEQLAIVWAAAVSWDISPGADREQLRQAFCLVNPRVDIGAGEKSRMPKGQAIAIRTLLGIKSNRSDHLNNLEKLQPPLEPHQLITTDEDFQVTLPMQLNRAEAKILYALLQRRIREDFVERNLVNEAHEALAAKIYYYITDTPLP